MELTNEGEKKSRREAIDLFTVLAAIEPEICHFIFITN